MTTLLHRVAVTLLVIALTATLAVTGSAASTPSAATEVSSCTTIDASGEYVLTEDIEDSASSGPCLVVTAGDVTVDGNGHALAGSGDGTGIAVRYGSDIAVRDVRVSGWATGIEVAQTQDATLDGATVTDNADAGVALRDAEATTITGSTVAENGEGISVERTGAATVRDSAVRDNAGGGILASDSSVAIEATTVTGNAESGVEGLFTGFTLRDATLADNGGAGLTVNVGSVDGRASTITGNDGPGVDSYASDVTVRESVLANNGGPGIAADGRTVDARRNYWGASDGPTSAASADGPLEDPVTGLLADGRGDAVTEGGTASVANVRFDPYYTSDPQEDAASTSADAPETTENTPNETVTDDETGAGPSDSATDATTAEANEDDGGNAMRDISRADETRTDVDGPGFGATTALLAITVGLTKLVRD